MGIVASTDKTCQTGIGPRSRSAVLRLSPTLARPARRDDR